jgi:hypothetical protein
MSSMILESIQPEIVVSHCPPRRPAAGGAGGSLPSCLKPAYIGGRSQSEPTMKRRSLFSAVESSQHLGVSVTNPCLLSEKE